MIKVLLLNYAEESMKFIEPLGICYIASSLRNMGHFVKLLDSRLSKCNINQFTEVILKEMNNFDLIGITCTQIFYNKNYIEDMRFLINKIRSENYSGHLTMGGYGPTIECENFLQLNVDSIVIGEGESIICNLANAIGKKENWKNLKGIAYKNSQNTIIKNANDEFPDLNTIPFPSRDILIDFNTSFGEQLINPSIQGSRGCYMKCSFCSTPKFFEIQGDNNYRLRSIKNMVDEMELLYNSGYNKFDFIDDNFLPIKYENAITRALELKNELQVRNIQITFFMEFRLENITLEMLEVLKKAGLRKLFIGIESFNESDLKLYNRTYNIENIIKSIDILIKSGFKPDLNSEYRFKIGYINFNPLSTIESLRTSGEMFKKYNFSYKKLFKRLYIYNNNNVLNKILIKFPEYSEQNYFKESNVGEYYKFLMKISNNYLMTRNHCRNIEKYINKVCNKTALTALDNIINIRHILDNNIYDIYMNGLDICNEPYGNNKVEKFFNEIINDKMQYYSNIESLLNEYDKGLGLKNYNLKFEKYY